MYLIQLLLPISGAKRSTYEAHNQSLRDELIERFGGLTAYTRSPAEGWWNPDAGSDADAAEHDDLVILEVVAASLDRDWWRSLRERLERELRQEEIHVRAVRIEKL